MSPKVDEKRMAIPRQVFACWPCGGDGAGVQKHPAFPSQSLDHHLPSLSLRQFVSARASISHVVRARLR